MADDAKGLLRFTCDNTCERADSAAGGGGMRATGRGGGGTPPVLALERFSTMLRYRTGTAEGRVSAEDGCLGLAYRGANARRPVPVRGRSGATAGGQQEGTKKQKKTRSGTDGRAGRPAAGRGGAIYSWQDLRARKVDTTEARLAPRPPPPPYFPTPFVPLHPPSGRPLADGTILRPGSCCANTEVRTDGGGW